MRAIIEPQGPPERGAPQAPLGRRLLWFAAIAAGGSLAVILAAYALKAPLSLLR